MPTKRIGRRFAWLLALGWLFTLPVSAQVAVAPMQITRQQFFNGTGAVLSAGCVNFFATGTSTPQAIYADSTGTSQLQNPLTLDSTGSASVWMTNTAYDIVMNAGVAGTACSVSVGTQLWKEVNKNPFSIINAGSNYIVASGTSDPSGSAGMLAYRSDIPCFRGFTTIWDCFVRLTDTQTLTNKTLVNPVISSSTGAVLSSPNINGTIVTGPPATYLVMANDLVTGTTLNKLAKINPAGLAGFAILPLISDTGGVTGIVVAGAGASGNATIQQSGSASCVFDNAVTSGDYAQISSSIAGDCHDAGAGFPTSGQILGRLLATNVGAGTYLVDLFGPEIKPPPAQVAGVVNLTAQAANIGATTIITTSANGFYRLTCYVQETQAATTSSTLPACNYIYTDGDSSFVETIPATFTSGANTVGSFGAMATSGPANYSFFAKSGTVIQYSTTGYVSSGATVMQYALHIRLEGPF